MLLFGEILGGSGLEDLRWGVGGGVRGGSSVARGGGSAPQTPIEVHKAREHHLGAISPRLVS